MAVLSCTMAPSAVIQLDAALRHPAIPAVGFGDLPVEIMLDILRNLDFDSFDKMLAVDWRLNTIIMSHWCSILPVIVAREFAPVDGFLAVLRDVILPDSGVSSQILTWSGISRGSLFKVLPTKRLPSLLNFCRVIKRWEAEFPGMRFSHVPQHSRSLLPHELCRLRSALYVWWRFARFFQGPAPCPSRLENTPEGRRSFVRQLSTAQLHEIWDAWETVRSAVATQLCPNDDTVKQTLSGTCMWQQVDQLGWGTSSEHLQIVLTMMQLSPEVLLHLLVYRHRFTSKASVVRFVRLRHPRIEDSMWDLIEAVDDVMDERFWNSWDRFPCRLAFPLQFGGILDHEQSDVEAQRVSHGEDADTVIVDLPQFLRDRDAYEGEVRRHGRLLPTRRS